MIILSGACLRYTSREQLVLSLHRLDLLLQLRKSGQKLLLHICRLDEQRRTRLCVRVRLVAVLELAARTESDIPV